MEGHCTDEEIARCFAHHVIRWTRPVSDGERTFANERRSLGCASHPANHSPNHPVIKRTAQKYPSLSIMMPAEDRISRLSILPGQRKLVNSEVS
jgi:hypothetical protein